MFSTIRVAAAAGLALCAAPAFAQNAACPAGQQTTVVRVSAITGTRAGFDQAVKDHIKWYRDHGYKANTITVGDVAAVGAGGGATRPEGPQVLSIHTNSPGVPPEKHDAAWNAYVAEYAANSKIISTTVACLPK